MNNDSCDSSIDACDSAIIQKSIFNKQVNIELSVTVCIVAPATKNNSK